MNPYFKESQLFVYYYKKLYKIITKYYLRHINMPEWYFN